jgi:hypothetical protein
MRWYFEPLTDLGANELPGVGAETFMYAKK